MNTSGRPMKYSQEGYTKFKEGHCNTMIKELTLKLNVISSHPIRNDPKPKIGVLLMNMIMMGQ